MLLLTLIRFTISVAILRFPLFGGLLALFIDYHDLNLLTFLDKGSLKNYQSWDKILDLNYLAIEAFIALQWKNKLVSRIAFMLFIYRLVGITTFEITQQKYILVAFPNIFEPFFLIYLLQLYLFKRDLFKSLKVVGVVVLIITILKITHEYLLHINTANPWTENEFIKQIINIVNPS